MKPLTARGADQVGQVDLADLADMDGLLPPVAQTLIAVIGLRTAMDLVRQAGGATIDIPKRGCSRGEASFEALAEMIGVDAALAMVKHFGGDTLYIPRCDAALRECEYRQIRATFDRLTRGDSAASARRAVAILAVRHRYSDRTIWSILKKPDRIGPAEQAARAAGQLGLF